MKSKALLISILILSFLFQKCEKDEDTPAYVGNWETEVYPFPVSETVFVDQKMSFEFTATSFESKIKNIISGVTMDYLGVRGSVTEKEGNKLDISLTEIGLFSAALNDFDWKTKVANAAEFNGTYSQTISGVMPQNFEARYEVEANSLYFIIDAIPDTIKLIK